MRTGRDRRSLAAAVMLALLTAACLFLPAAPARAQFEYAGLPIISVEFKTDAPTNMDRLHALTSLEAGKTLHVSDMQRTIERLYSTGEFRDIRIDAVPSGDGVALTVILSLSYRIDEIGLEGAEDLESRAKSELVIHVGDILSLDAVDRSAIAIQEMLRRRGYLEATVDPETQFSRETNSAQVTFHVDREVRAKIAAIELEGDLTPFTRETLIERMKDKPGDFFRRELTRGDASRLRSFLARKGYRKAEVRFVDDQYDKATRSVRLRYRVVVGPLVRVEVRGVPRSRAIRRLLPFHGDESWSEDLVLRAADAIRDRYQKRGYHFATVDTEETLSDNTWTLTYIVEPGVRYGLQEVRFAGNEQVSDDKLREVVSVTKRGGFFGFVKGLMGRPSGVTDEQLVDDRDSIEAYYRLHGFTEPDVQDPVVQPGSEGLIVTFPITEGSQTHLTEVRIEGNEDFTIDELPKLRLGAGDELNPTLVTEDLNALQIFYANRGYAEIQINARVNFAAGVSNRTDAELVYQIAEGPKVAVGAVVVRGNTFTDRTVILKKVGLRKGDPYSLRSVFEAQRDLYRLGIFQRVDVLPEQAGANAGTRDIVIQVEEGKNLSIGGGVGYDTQYGARGTAQISHRNLFGTGRYLGLDARVSQRQDNRYVLTYREPFLLDYNIPTELTFFRWNEKPQDATFRRLGTSVEASHVMGKTRWSLRYEYKVTKCVSGKKCDAVTGDIPIEGVPRERQEVRLSSVTPSFFWDSRNDPLNPHRGLFASSALQYAFPLFQAEAQFLKAFEQATWYRPLSLRSELVLSGRVGLIKPVRDTGPSSVVPISERFVAGGDNTHRAFALDSLGIQGETLVCIEDDPVTGGSVIVPCVKNGDIVALGGNGMVLLNAEYRFPMFSSVGGALFVDAGNVWRELGDIETGDLRYGAGVGIRYLTPVGPLRIDVGFKLDRKDYEDPYAFFISLGFPF